MAGFTQGPWVHRYSESFVTQPGERGEHSIEAGFDVVAVVEYNGEDETEANAHLIAAAPDLLEVLVALYKRIDDPEYDEPHFESFNALSGQARSAIAKALGEEVPA